MTDQELKDLAVANLVAIKELREFQKETIKERKETDRLIKETAKEMEATDRQMKAVARKLDTLGTRYGNLSNNIGSVAENFFFSGLEASKQIASIPLGKIDRNVKCWNNEYDIVGVNGESVVLVSVKHILRKYQVEKFIAKELKQFVKDFPRYKKHKIYGAVAGMDIEKEAVEEAVKSGVFVLTQAGKNIKVLNAKTFKPKAI